MVLFFIAGIVFSSQKFQLYIRVAKGLHGVERKNNNRIIE